ncbi:MAG: ATP phosphoribosyltransferase regulatory subunit [Pseudomonadota bacterium]|nr:ATP phosphoribosyltransferase regulatory subunit [Pseudomonadota bacterium]
MIGEAVPPQSVLDAVRAPLAPGAEPLDPPVLQPLGLLLDLLGEALRARLCVVQGEGVEDACLRPDFTVAVAREHLRRGAPAGRYIYEGPAFRAPPAGSVRPQEFLQLGCELIGGDGGDRDEVAIASAAVMAARAGGREDLTLLMGDLALFDAFCEGVGVPPPARLRLRQRLGSPAAFNAELQREPARPGGSGQLADLLSRLPPEAAAGVLEEIWTLAGVVPVGGRTPAEIARRLADRGDPAVLGDAQRGLIERFVAIEGEPLEAIEAAVVLARRAGLGLDAHFEGWARRVAALAAAGVELSAQRLCFGFGRPFGYYDGFLFEVRSSALPSDAPVAAGGRYDGLLGRLQPGADATAVGCMVRPGRAWSGAPA